MAKSDLEFSNRDDLEAWLADKPIEWSQVIAARAALRVFPLCFNYYQDFTLYSFRACLISWIANKYPASNMEFVAASAIFSSTADTYAAHSASAAVATIAARTVGRNNVQDAAQHAASAKTPRNMPRNMPPPQTCMPLPMPTPLSPQKPP